MIINSEDGPGIAPLVAACAVNLYARTVNRVRMFLENELATCHQIKNGCEGSAELLPTINYLERLREFAADSLTPTIVKAT